MNAGESKSPRLTIVIPTLNRASLVGRAIDSALAQTYPDLEIIVSNNGSTDGTRGVLERYEGAPRTRIIHREETVPPSTHGNLLIQEARGELYLGLSDDDWLEPEFASQVIDMYDRHPGIAFVWTGCLMHYADAAMPAATGPEVESGIDFLAGFLAGSRNICWCACVTRREDLKRVGPQPLDAICGDMFYWTKIAPLGEVGCVARPISNYVVYRDGGDNEAGGTDVLRWAQDTARWVRDILAACERGRASLYSPEQVRRHAGRFLARSVANQFVWNRLRGTNRLDLVKSIPPTLPYLTGGGFGIWLRLLAALVLPRSLLRNRVVAMARANSRR